MNKIKHFIKELKRVRWPKMSEAMPLFVKVLIFIIAASLALFGLTVGLTALWNTWGVGING